jgi:hypothetical protein
MLAGLPHLCLVQYAGTLPAPSSPIIRHCHACTSCHPRMNHSGCDLLKRAPLWVSPQQTRLLASVERFVQTVPSKAMNATQAETLIACKLPSHFTASPSPAYHPLVSYCRSSPAPALIALTAQPLSD